MLGLLDIIATIFQYGVVYAIQPAFVIVNQVQVDLPEVGEVRQVEFKRMRQVDDSSCVFKGVMVPYARDWDEVTETAYGQQVRKAVPDEVGGYAIVLDKKVCDNSVEKVAYVDSYFGGIFGRMTAGLQRDANDLSVLHGEARPRWLEQVARYLEEKGYQDEAAAARVHPSPETIAKQQGIEPVKARTEDASLVLNPSSPLPQPSVDLKPAI